MKSQKVEDKLQVPHVEPKAEAAGDVRPRSSVDPQEHKTLNRAGLQIKQGGGEAAGLHDQAITGNIEKNNLESVGWGVIRRQDRNAGLCF